MRMYKKSVQKKVTCVIPLQCSENGSHTEITECNLSSNVERHLMLPRDGPFWDNTMRLPRSLQLTSQIENTKTLQNLKHGLRCDHWQVRLSVNKKFFCDSLKRIRAIYRNNAVSASWTIQSGSFHEAMGNND